MPGRKAKYAYQAVHPPRARGNDANHQDHLVPLDQQEINHALPDHAARQNGGDVEIPETQSIEGESIQDFSEPG